MDLEDSISKRFGPSTSIQAPIVSVEIPIRHEIDDVVEDQYNRMWRIDKRVELLYSSGHKVGLRFDRVPVPAGAVIESASIIFSNDYYGCTNPNLQLRIRAHSMDDSPAFTNEFKGLTSRPVTSADVLWNPGRPKNESSCVDCSGVGPWHLAGDQQESADVATLLQEVVDRRGWARGQALSLIITHASGSTSGNHRCFARSKEGEYASDTGATGNTVDTSGNTGTGSGSGVVTFAPVLRVRFKPPSGTAFLNTSRATMSGSSSSGATVQCRIKVAVLPVKPSLEALANAAEQCSWTNSRAINLARHRVASAPEGSKRLYGVGNSVTSDYMYTYWASPVVAPASWLCAKNRWAILTASVVVVQQ
jgi:hypothetical protein